MNLTEQAALQNTTSASSYGQNKLTKRKHKHNRPALFFLLPMLAFYVVFYVYAFYFLIQTSFQEVTLSFRNAKPVGLENYSLVLTHNLFFSAVLNTFVFAGILILASLTLGFVLAVILSFKIPGRAIFFSIFLLPTLIPPSMIAAVFGSMLEYRFGTFNELLRSVGLGALAQRWLVDPQLAYMAVISIFVYLIGLPILYYTADLSTIDTSVIEAALIDGASVFQLFRLILFPLLNNAHKTVIVTTFLTIFRAFEVVFLFTGGGPSNTTDITSTYIYTFMRTGNNIGYVSAASVIVLFFALIFSVIQLTLYRRARNER
jgi:ABC-type sugar transport system permease subunit